MAEIGELEEQIGDCDNGPLVSSISHQPSSVDVSSFTHTPCYCEENIYFLCRRLSTLGIAEPNSNDLFVMFISNEEKKVPLWYQKSSQRPDGLVIWDYHVVCIQLRQQKPAEDNAYCLVWDLDSSLTFPCSLKQYIAEAIRPSLSLILTFGRLFRVVHAPCFLRSFASDRSHMKTPQGYWLSPPPAYEPIIAEDGTTNNLDQYIRMLNADVRTKMEESITDVFSNGFGAVLREPMLEEFFENMHTLHF